VKLVALTLARNEDWILGMTGRIALRWCDAWVVVDHASQDGTCSIVRQIADEHPGRVHLHHWPHAEQWDEMDARDFSLAKGREAGGTHFAIVDSDEFLTANLLGQVRPMCESLKDGQLLDLPMIPAWRALTRYRDDLSVWSHAWLTLAFKDVPGLIWKVGEGGYQHHNRPPCGAREARRYLGDKRYGGVVHAQFANWRRLKAKHALYPMVDHLRWPGRESVKELNRKYAQALDETGLVTTACPPDWLESYHGLIGDYFHPEGVPWQEKEIERLIARHGRGAFADLDLKGF